MGVERGSAGRLSFAALPRSDSSLIGVQLAVACVGRIAFPLALPVILPAGSEAPFALARRGVRVRLHEMRPVLR